MIDLETLDNIERFSIGLTTPLLFSNHAIDISPIRIRRLIDTFLRTCSDSRPGSPSDLKWREEAQFSGPHELAMTLRWGLARIVRISQGQETRGILSWETYLRWREDEGGESYDPVPFVALVNGISRGVIPATILFDFFELPTSRGSSFAR